MPTLVDKVRGNIPETVQVEVEEIEDKEPKKIKLTIGIKNSLPVTSESGRWSSMSPFLSITTEIDFCDDLTDKVVDLYARMLPAYGFLLVKEYAQVMNIIAKNPAAVGMELITNKEG